MILFQYRKFDTFFYDKYNKNNTEKSHLESLIKRKTLNLSN